MRKADVFPQPSVRLYDSVQDKNRIRVKNGFVFPRQSCDFMHPDNFRLLIPYLVSFPEPKSFSPARTRTALIVPDGMNRK